MNSHKETIDRLVTFIMRYEELCDELGVQIATDNDVESYLYDDETDSFYKWPSLGEYFTSGNYDDCILVKIE